MLQRGSSISNNLSPQGLSAECDSTAPGSPCAFQMYWADFEALSTPLVVGCCAPPSTAVCMSVVRGGPSLLAGRKGANKTFTFAVAVKMDGWWMQGFLEFGEWHLSCLLLDHCFPWWSKGHLLQSCQHLAQTSNEKHLTQPELCHCNGSV